MQEPAPHVSPSVLRLQLRVSVRATMAQDPPPHSRSVTVRDWVPLSPHMPPKPEQVPHGPLIDAPQPSPSVFREQERSSVPSDRTQSPAEQRKVVVDRLWVPASSHVSPKEPQAP